VDTKFPKAGAQFALATGGEVGVVVVGGVRGAFFTPRGSENCDAPAGVEDSAHQPG
jgi:hypothetical protein